MRSPESSIGRAGRHVGLTAVPSESPNDRTCLSWAGSSRAYVVVTVDPARAGYPTRQALASRPADDRPPGRRSPRWLTGRQCPGSRAVSAPGSRAVSAPAHGPSVPLAHGPSVPRLTGSQCPWLTGRQCPWLTGRQFPRARGPSVPLAHGPSVPSACWARPQVRVFSERPSRGLWCGRPFPRGPSPPGRARQSSLVPLDPSRLIRVLGAGRAHPVWPVRPGVFPSRSCRFRSYVEPSDDHRSCAL